MEKKVQTHNGKDIVYLDRHPIVVRARRKFKTARREDIFLLDKKDFYWEIGNYFTHFFHNDRTYLDIWHDYPSYGEFSTDIRYTNLPKSSSSFPVFGIAEGDFAAYALFSLTPTPVLDKNDKKIHNFSDGIAVLNSDFRIRGVSCLFTSDLYDHISRTLGISLKIKPTLASQSSELLEKYERSLSESKQELEETCTKLSISLPIRHKMGAPKISRTIQDRLGYKDSFGVWLP